MRVSKVQLPRIPVKRLIIPTEEHKEDSGSSSGLSPIEVSSTPSTDGLDTPPMDINIRISPVSPYFEVIQWFEVPLGCTPEPTPEPKKPKIGAELDLATIQRTIQK